MSIEKEDVNKGISEKEREEGMCASQRTDHDVS